jgi:hypothetical protein
MTTLFCPFKIPLIEIDQAVADAIQAALANRLVVFESRMLNFECAG